MQFAHELIARKRDVEACVRHYLDTGELSPAYLAKGPMDPFDGRPIRYERISQGIKLWTIAEDLKDDGGDIGRVGDVERGRPPDHGWVILNPELRGRNRPDNSP